MRGGNLHLLTPKRLVATGDPMMVIPNAAPHHGARHGWPCLPGSLNPRLSCNAAVPPEKARYEEIAARLTGRRPLLSKNRSYRVVTRRCSSRDFFYSFNVRVNRRATPCRASVLNASLEAALRGVPHKRQVAYGSSVDIAYCVFGPRS